MDSFTEVTEQSCLSRIIGSFVGVAIGLVFIVVAGILLFWNEGRAVTTARSLAEGKGALRVAAADKVDPANDQKLVYLNGQATTSDTVSDPQYGVSAQGLVLKRKVEMYQWQEEKHSTTRNKIGGGTETVTTYNYKGTWSSTHIDSSHFKHPEGHHNPEPDSSKTSQDFVAKKVSLGAFTLSDELVKKIDQSEPVSVNKVPDNLAGKAKLLSDGYYLGEDPNSPLIGDVKVRFSVVKPTTVSVIAEQSSGTLIPYQTKAGDKLEMLVTGTQSPEVMFKSAEESNNTLAWVLRVVGYILMVIGLSSLFGPFVATASILPFVGDLLEAGIVLFALVVGAFISLIIIAVAWVVYRPIVGAGIIIGALVLLVAGRSVFKK
jgi:hypothetical protein